VAKDKVAQDSHFKTFVKTKKDVLTGQLVLLDDSVYGKNPGDAYKGYCYLYKVGLRVTFLAVWIHIQRQEDKTWCQTL